MTFIFVPFMILFMNISNAQTTCTPKHEVMTLGLVNPASSSLVQPVQVRYEVQNGNLEVSFQVNSPVLHKKEVYGPSDYPFQYDVVEVFLTTENTNASRFSYYEFEVTPLGQVYDLRLDVVDGKRTGVDIEPVVTQARFSSTDWSASFSIPLTRVGLMSDDLSQLRGNFFTIIGKEPRTYWSAFLPPQQKANFHKPEYFQPLFDCK